MGCFGPSIGPIGSPSARKQKHTQMVLGIPFRRAPVATCDLIQAVLGSAVPEDTAVAEQAQRLKMAFALATSKPSGKEFTLKCKELLKADSVGIYAVAHNTSQLRNCLPLALLATSEPEDAIDSGVSQLRTEAMIHCVGAKDGASTIVACAGKSCARRSAGIGIVCCTRLSKRRGTRTRLQRFTGLWRCSKPKTSQCDLSEMTLQGYATSFSTIIACSKTLHCAEQVACLHCPVHSGRTSQKCNTCGFQASCRSTSIGSKS